MTLRRVTILRKKDTKFGIIFCRKSPHSPLTIQSMLKDGVFYGQGFAPGMVVTEINAKRVQWETPVEAAMMLQNTPIGGFVSIVVEIFCAVGKRHSKYTPWGLYLVRPKESSGVIIAKVTGQFENTELRENMKIIEINGEPCPRRARDAFKILDETKHELQITAVNLHIVDVDENWPKPGVPETVTPNPETAPGNIACALDGYVSVFGCGFVAEGEGQNPKKQLRSMREMKSITFPLSAEYYKKTQGGAKSSPSQHAPVAKKPRKKPKNTRSFFEIWTQRWRDDSISETSLEEGPSEEDPDVVYEKTKKSIFKKLVPRLRKKTSISTSDSVALP
ncbi:unnamed protein product [Cylindrotheca closterium]|uniref:PDZ domain-containing protein n=1 Tax=Cylindrotheca closterium TaxID=2856 RepID=A0AAD2FJA0_9STRA|nr:unnamed protein product [Cylindrotheca closterium]